MRSNLHLPSHEIQFQTSCCRYRFDDEKAPTKILNPVLKGTDKHKGGVLRLDAVDMKDICLLFYEKYNPSGSNPGE